MSDVKLLLSVSTSTIISCYDMISVYGGDPTGKSVEEIVSDVLTSLVYGMRDDKLVPTYESETELLAKLEEYFPELQSARIAKINEITEQVQNALGTSSEDIVGVKEAIAEGELEKAIETVEIEEEQSEREGSNGSDSEAFTFDKLPVKDPIVLEAKGDKMKEESLVEVYGIIDRDLWGTKNAHSMWLLVLSKKETAST